MDKKLYIKKLEKIVSKDAAIILRDMGFNQFCDYYYHTDNDSEDDYDMGDEQMSNECLTGERCSAPYVTQALLWLIKVTGIAFNVRTYHDNKSATGYVYVVKLMFGNYGDVSCDDADYQTALRDAIDALLVGTCISEHPGQFKFVQKEC